MPQFPLPSSTKHERPRQAEVVSHQREMARGLYLAECSALLASYSAAARGGGSGGGGEGLLASVALGGRGASVAACGPAGAVSLAKDLSRRDPQMRRKE